MSCAHVPSILGSTIFPTWKILRRQPNLYQYPRTSRCSRSLNALAHIDLFLSQTPLLPCLLICPYDMLPYSVIIYAYKWGKCHQALTACQYTNEAYSIPLSRWLLSFLEIFGFSDLLTASSSYSLPLTLTLATQKPLRGGTLLLSPLWEYCLFLGALKFIQSCGAKDHYSFSSHCVPRRSPELTPLPNPQSDFIPLDPTQ